MRLIKLSMRNLKIVLAVIVLLAAVHFILGYLDRMTGTVVDAETGKPIEGAVVLVEWTRTKGFGNTYTTSYAVKEKVTDENGQLTVFGIVNPFTNQPDVTVYKKGYVAWSSRWIFPDRRNRTDFRWGNNVFKLEHFKKGYSYIDHTSFIDSSMNASINLKAKKTIYNAYSWEDQLASKERDQKNKKRH